jgi:hypothetical protein
VDSPSFNGRAHQYGQDFGGCAEAEEGPENWAGRGFTLPVGPETLGPDDPGE